MKRPLIALLCILSVSCGRISQETPSNTLPRTDFSFILGKNVHVSEQYNISLTKNDNNILSVLNFSNNDGYAVFDKNKHLIALVESGNLNKDTLISTIQSNLLSNDITGRPKYALIAYLGLSHSDYFNTKTLLVGDSDTSLYHTFFTRIDTLVRPLCKNKWGQEFPFNINMPVAPPNTAASRGKSLVGCGPLAIAMMFTTNNHPSYLPDINNQQYNTSDFLPIADTSSLHLFRDYSTWQNGCPSYLKNRTKQLSSVFHRIADELNVSYSPNGTATVPNNIPTFCQGIDALYRNCSLKSTITERQKLINMLAQGRATIICGHNSTIGHIWVVDGYISGLERDILCDSKLVHFNWGWTSDSDGYYSLDILDTAARAFKDTKYDISTLVITNHQYDSEASFLYY